MSIDLHALAEQARRMGYHTPAQIAMRLTRMIYRNSAYLSRRASRGTHTPVDDSLAEDSAVAALVIELLEEAK